MKQAYIY